MEPSQAEQGEVIDPDYLPFTEDQFLGHFAPAGSDQSDPQRHLAYYRASAKAKAELAALLGPGAERAGLGAQMERDERFWVAGALMRVFHSPGRDTALAGLLARCLGDKPPVAGLATWAQALGGDPHLYFDVSLPSPAGYAEHLARCLDERVPIPHLRAAATVSRRLEGATKVDAVIVAPDTGFAVLFEAKVLSDISAGVRFDVLRNRIARSVDVMLERNTNLTKALCARDPDRTCFVLLTPEVFRAYPESRLYGWLMNGYREDAGLLRAHLPHRHGADFGAVATRLGWLTWEDINRVQPGSCPWLGAAAVA